MGNGRGLLHPVAAAPGGARRRRRHPGAQSGRQRRGHPHGDGRGVSPRWHGARGLCGGGGRRPGGGDGRSAGRHVSGGSGHGAHRPAGVHGHRPHVSGARTGPSAPGDGAGVVRGAPRPGPDHHRRRLLLPPVRVCLWTGQASDAGGTPEDQLALPPGWQVRDAEPGDVERIQELQVEAQRHVDVALPFAENLWRPFLEMAAAPLLVGVSDGQVEAVARLRVAPGSPVHVQAVAAS